MSTHRDNLGTAICALAGLALAACNGPSEPAPQPAAASAEGPAPVAPATAPAVVEAEAEPDADALPVAEDFEQEVAAAITADNYATELDALEQELAAAE